MTYNVFGGTLNLIRSISQFVSDLVSGLVCKLACLMTCVAACICILLSLLMFHLCVCVVNVNIRREASSVSRVCNTARSTHTILTQVEQSIAS